MRFIDFRELENKQSDDYLFILNRTKMCFEFWFKNQLNFVSFFKDFDVDKMKSRTF